MDILALQETRVDNKSAQHHDDYVFYFSTSVNQGQKSRVEKSNAEIQSQT